MKYKIANNSNCKEPSHLFQRVTDERKKFLIRKQHPRLKAPLWECIFCKRITEST